MDWNDPPILPSLNLPTQVLPNPPNLPEPILSVPRADIPSYQPMIAPPDEPKGQHIDNLYVMYQHKLDSHIQ